MGFQRDFVPLAGGGGNAPFPSSFPKKILKKTKIIKKLKFQKNYNFNKIIFWAKPLPQVVHL